MAQLARIVIYPIKSLDPLSLPQAQILPSGALEHDRRFALIDLNDVLLTAKCSPLVHRIRCRYDLSAWTVVLEYDGQSQGFHLEFDRAALADWLSSRLNKPLRLVENAAGGFPDDLDSPGPTVVSTATLQAVADWLGLPVDEVAHRFRANLEVEGVEAFWEDRLYAAVGNDISFTIGDVQLAGTNPCQRCPVPTRDPTTGDVWPGFAKVFAGQRASSLPAWAHASRFDHYYRLATNTRPRTGGLVHVGDEVRILGPASDAGV